MGSDGVAAMAAIEHPMPDNTLPMMTGFGQFGPLEMGRHSVRTTTAIPAPS
jgi:manganese oxidase